MSLLQYISPNSPQTALHRQNKSLWTFAPTPAILGSPFRRSKCKGWCCLCLAGALHLYLCTWFLSICFRDRCSRSARERGCSCQNESCRLVLQEGMLVHLKVFLLWAQMVEADWLEKAGNLIISENNIFCEKQLSIN